jgi:hypothetical protein
MTADMDDWHAELRGRLGDAYGRELTISHAPGAGRLQEPVRDARGRPMRVGDVVAIYGEPRHVVNMGLVMGMGADLPRVHVHFGDDAEDDWWPDALVIVQSAARPVA